MAYNDPDQAPRVSIVESPVRELRDRLPVAPCSVTVFRLDVE